MSALILSEFTNDNLSGIDCRYEDKYLLLEQEFDKQNSMYGDEPDWSLIKNNTIDLLEHTTKDLKIASWWIFSSLKLESWYGIEKNITTFNDLIKIFGEDLFPKSQKGKSNIIYWLEETLNQDIINNKNINIVNHIALYNNFLELNESINILLEDNKKYFKKVLDFLEPYYLKELEAQNSVKNMDNDPNIANETIEFNSLITNENDAQKHLNNIKKSISVLTEYYRSNETFNLISLRLSRFNAWIDIDELPYTDHGKTTPLYPPSIIEIDELNSLINEKQYIKALQLAEEIIEVSPFWLEGHHIVYDILIKIEKEQEANEVKNHLRTILETLKGIEEYQFNDNTAFASKRMQNWIDKELFTSNNSSVSNDESDPFNNQLEAIYELIGNKKIKEAMLQIEKNYVSSLNSEDKFKWRLIHAQIAVENDKKKLALALIQDLLIEIKKYDLDNWNPSLASKVYMLALNSFTNVDIEQDKLEDIYNNLCKIDTNGAYEIKF